MRTTTLPKLAAGIATLAMLFTATITVAHAAPVASKFVFSSHIGWDVNQTTGGNICTIASKNTCQRGIESGQSGGFNSPKGVAVDNDPSSPFYTDVYIADENNHRVQVLSATGKFVSMFGREVNKTTGGDICTAESHNECQAGVEGAAPGQMYEGFSIAIDNATGDVFLAERVLGKAGGEVVAFDYRVQEFTDAGAWLAEIGKEVNQTTKENLCTKQEVEAHGVKCQGPVLIPGGSSHASTEHGAFNPFFKKGNILAVGGSEDRLYVGDEHRVQEFDATTGQWKGEIPLASISSEPGSDVSALAVDATGDVYLAYKVGEKGTTVIREFNAAGVEVEQFEVTPAEADPERKGFGVLTFTLDPYGRLGVTTDEAIANTDTHPEEFFVHGALYSATGARFGEFNPPSASFPGEANSLAFSASDELYVAGGGSQEVEAYAPALFPEVVTCAASEVSATSATLCGSINANGLVARGFFDFDPPAAAHTPVAFEGEGTAPESVSWHLTGLSPNQTYGYDMVGEAEVAGEPVTGSGEQLAFHTLTPPPEIPGEPSASNVTDSFALLSASVNPEHAPARYHFQYGPCAALAGCAGVLSTADRESSVYGRVGAVQEIAGLQPQTTYSYRLVADNEHEEAGHVIQGGEAAGAEGHFTTGVSPVPVAQAGSASLVGVSSATIAGLVDPDGQPAVYTFELGVYEGAGTRYGVVFSGPVGASATPVAESLALSGLQPGTTYAYRIVVRSGYGESVGEPSTFTTAGLPAALTVPAPLAMLAVPSVVFPGEARGSATTTKRRGCSHGKKRERGKCVASRRKAHGRRGKKAGRSRKAKR